MSPQVHQPTDDMPTVPIPARRVVTTFDSASKHERIEAKPPLVRLFRRAVSTVFNLWMRVSTPVVEQLGWYDQIEPYVGYGTEAYPPICRTVYAPSTTGGARIRGIGACWPSRAPPPRARGHRRTPLETVQVGTSNPMTNRTPNAGRPPIRGSTPPATSTRR